MSVTNPFSITYGAITAGGASSTYQLNGPYVIDYSYRGFRLVFDVIVVATSYATLQSLSDALEAEFRKRDLDTTININGNTWTYTAGTDYFNPVSSIAKSGDSETDRGFSRAYTCIVEAELPSDDDGTGLLEIRYSVSFEPTRQRIVSVEGTYTATTAATSAANYLANASTVINTFLTALDAAAKWELLDEDYDQDRNTANTVFSRQYSEILFDQTKNGRKGHTDGSDIKDHRVIFTDLSQHPADSREGVQRLRRVVGAYDCAIDIERTTDLQDVFDDQVKPFVVQTFKDNFNPQVWSVEDRRISYDETTKRLSVSIQFLYQKADGENVVEVSQSVAYREARTIDYTPTHAANELAQYADVGWATVERVWTRTAVVLGDELPQRRLGVLARFNELGDFDNVGRLQYKVSKDVVPSGWNVISNTSQVTEQWIGDPSDDRSQIKLSAVTETVVERLHIKPGTNTFAQ